MNKLSRIFNLIGERYLDVTHSSAYVESIEKQLRGLGVFWLIRWPLEVFAAGGLWWNLFVWEWEGLGFFDMLVGWVLNAKVCTVLFLSFWFIFSESAGVIACTIYMLVAWRVGFGLRQGSYPKEEAER